jgi:hypothetical protein
VKKAREAVPENAFPEVEKQSLLNEVFEAVKAQYSTIVFIISMQSRTNANISRVFFEKIQRLRKSRTPRGRSARPDSILL